jgi:hypothetical protein
MMVQNKLGCLSLASLSCMGIMFAERYEGAYPRGEALNRLATHKYWTRLESLDRDRQFNLLGFIVTELEHRKLECLCLESLSSKALYLR